MQHFSTMLEVADPQEGAAPCSDCLGWGAANPFQRPSLTFQDGCHSDTANPPQ